MAFQSPLRSLARALALLAGCLATCSPAPEARPRNVVLVCIDTLRADHLSCYGHPRETTPALDALARRSLVFTNVRSTSGWTKPSVPSFLTGTYPVEHGVYLGGSDSGAGRASDVLPASATTLAEVFQAAGYQTAAFVKNAQLAKGLGFEQGFDLYVDRAGDAREVRWRATDWLEARDPERPFFLYLHLLDVHWPWPVPDEYRTRWADEELLAELWRDDWRDLREGLNARDVDAGSPEAQVLRDVYDGAIRWVDDQLALLLDELDEEGLTQDTVFSVVSDHGEEFFEHGRLGHGHGLWENLLAVPWILHVPGGPSGRVAAPASLVDLFPTLLAAAGRAAPPSRGIDRLATPEQRAARLAEHLEPGSYQRSIERDGRKLVRSHGAEALLSVAGPGGSEAMPQGRFEARIEGEGRPLRASRLRRDDDEERATEVKGPIEAIEAGFLLVNGVRVATRPMPELYGETLDASGQPRALAAGMLVKARGTCDAQGDFRAEKLKLYAPDAELEREVRGQVTRFDPGGSIWLGQVEVRFDPRTMQVEVDERPRLDRDTLARWLALEPTLVVADDQSHDLAADAAELAPLDGDPFGLAGELERRTRALFLRRTWGAQDRVSLSDDELQELKALGYAE